MDGIINKLYTSVSSTVSQLSGVLPGNPVTREFEISEHISNAGLGLLWKVYKGYKKTTRQEVAVFVFEKKQLERWPKEDRDNMFDILKRGIIQLTKIRHPNVLTVQHPLEESRESLAFATEPVYSCLANLLVSNNSNNANTTTTEDTKLYDVEIKHGILQITEGLIFLHSDMKLVHRNLCPESIILNKCGSWKIFGFDFCLSNQITSDGKYFWPHQEYNSTWHALTQPYLEYTAPEVALCSSISPESDHFALGVIIYSIYAGGKPIKLFGKDYNSFRRFASELNQGKYPNLTCIPDGLSEFVKSLLHVNPDMRPKLYELPKISFFDDIAVKTLNYLDSLYQWDNLQKSKFYKGLLQIIPTLPHRINIQHIMPCLVKEFLNPSMIPFVLPNVLLIASKSSKQEYVENILNYLKPVMKLQDPIQILLIFMQNMNILLKLTPPEDVKVNVLPMLYRALECDMPQMQELCLGVLPTFSSLIDYHATKNALIPRIKKLCLGTQNISIKVNCLICIGKLLDGLDKWLVLDEILPFLTQIQSREPAVLMGIIGIYRIAMTNSKLGITKEIMATKIIPSLMPLCIENGLTINQFNSIIGLVKEMVTSVEKDHRIKLEQLNTINRESGTLDPSSMTNDFQMNTTQSLPPVDVFANIKINPPPSFEKPLKPIQDENNMSNKVANVDTVPKTFSPTSFISPITLPQTYNPPNNAELGINNRTAVNNIQQIATNNNRSDVMALNNFMKSNTPTSTMSLSAWPNITTPPNANRSILANSNNNASSLSSIDPLLGIRSNNKIPMNNMLSTSEMGGINTPLLKPQNDQKQESNNITSLSQQDILDFLN